MDYLLHILVLVAIYTILAVSLDLVAGHCGLLAICHAAFWGLGAYTSALLSVTHGTPFLVGLPVSMAVAAIASLLVSLPSLRLADDYFVIATFGFQMIAFSIFNNWVDVTRGPLGIPGIPAPLICGVPIDSPLKFVILSGICAAAAYFVVWRLATSPFGRVLHAIREDEMLASALGKNTLRFKVIAFAVSASLAAMAGGLYAHYITYIDPAGFTITESILLVSMVIIGGAGSSQGPFIGAFVLVVLPEGLRFLGLPSTTAANVRQIIYGGLLVVLMMFRPQGLVGRYRFHR